MSKIFDFDARKNSYVNQVDGQMYTVTTLPIADGTKGKTYKFNGNSSRITKSDTSLRNLSKLTIVVWFKLDKINYNPFFDASVIANDYSNRLTFGGWNDSKIYCTICNGSSTTTGYVSFSDTTRWHEAVLVYDGTQSTNALKNKLYIDGALQTLTFSGTIPTTLSNTLTTINVGYDTPSAKYSNSQIQKVEVHNIAFTQSQIDADYQDFLNSKPLKKATTNFIKQKPTSLSENGLLAAYNMKRVGNVINDISGNGYNLTTITKALSTDKGTRIVQGILSGPDTFVTTSTVSIRFKTLASDNVGLLVSGIRWSRTTYTTSIYVNGNAVYVAGAPNTATTYGAANVILAGQWNTLTIVWNGVSTFKMYVNGVEVIVTNGTANYYTGYNLAFGDRTTSGGVYLDCEIEDCRIYNRALSLTEITNYHNQFVQPTLIESFDNIGADGQTKGIQGWTIRSGTWKISENIATQSSGLKVGDKYLECATAGVITIPNNPPLI